MTEINYVGWFSSISRKMGYQESGLSSDSQTDSVQAVDNLMPLMTVLNCSGTGCSTNSSPDGIMTFISEDLAVMMAVSKESLLKNI